MEHSSGCCGKDCIKDKLNSKAKRNKAKTGCIKELTSKELSNLIIYTVQSLNVFKRIVQQWLLVVVQYIM